MKKIVSLIAILSLTACATPVITMQNKKGDVTSCGGGTIGSVVGGLPGYAIQKHNDQSCVEELKTKGYKVIDVK